MRQALLSLLFWLCLFSPSWSAITFDAQSQAPMFDAVVFSWTHPVGAGCTNNIVIVPISHYNANFTSLSGVTVGGVAATQVATLGGAERLTLFRRTGATTGNNTIEVTFSGSNGVAIGTARSYCGDQIPSLGTPVTANSYGSTVTVDVSSATGELVVDSALVLSTPSTATVGAGQTERSNLTDLTAANFRQVESDQAGDVSVTMSWSLVPVSLSGAPMVNQG